MKKNHIEKKLQKFFSTRFVFEQEWILWHEQQHQMKMEGKLMKKFSL